MTTTLIAFTVSILSLIIGFLVGECNERHRWKKQMRWAKEMEEKYGLNWVEELTQRAQRTMWL